MICIAWYWLVGGFVFVVGFTFLATVGFFRWVFS